MAKKRSPRQQGVADAWAQPERRFFCSRQMCWMNRRWPFEWGFFTDWKILTMDFGNVKNKFYGVEVPEPWLSVTVGVRPFRVVVCRGHKRVLWLGDWEWKRQLSSG